MFIEDKPGFHRYDIVKRIIRVLDTLYKLYNALFIISKNTDYWELIYYKPYSYLKLLTNTEGLRNIISIILPTNRIIILSEQASLSSRILCKSRQPKCFVLGLHSDFSYDILKMLGLVIEKDVNLGNVSYITSHCIYIIYYLERLCQYK